MVETSLNYGDGAFIRLTTDQFLLQVSFFLQTYRISSPDLQLLLLPLS